MKKKFIALLLSGALLVSTAVWPASAASVEQFTDVDSGDWFYTHVDYVAENGLPQRHQPNHLWAGGLHDRGMFVTVLGNMTGIDTGLYPGSRFDDVPASEYYASRINWATENGIVSGLGGRKFGPENSVTREQAATMLYNYAKRTGNDTSYSASVYNSFPDTSAVSLLRRGTPEVGHLPGHYKRQRRQIESPGHCHPRPDCRHPPQRGEGAGQDRAAAHSRAHCHTSAYGYPCSHSDSFSHCHAPAHCGPTPTPSTPASNIVYWTPSGKAYHRPTCPTIDNSKT